MNLGAVIRNARRNKDLTQERLAEFLNVSVSAVSQWELNKTAPDLALIPPLCHLLGISADTLLGIDVSQNEEAIRAIAMESDRHLSRGYTEEARRIALGGLTRYPDSDVLIELVMNSYAFERYRGNAEARAENARLVIEWANRLLAVTENAERRYSALYSLAITYDEAGDQNKAKEIAMQLPTRGFSREGLLCSIGTPTERLEAKRNLAASLTHDLAFELSYHNVHMEDGSMAYTDEECVRLWEMSRDLYHLIYDQGDYGFVHCRLSDIGVFLARYYVRQGQSERALDLLSESADHAIAFVQWVKEGGTMVHTSLALRGKESIGFCTTGSGNEAQMLLDQMSIPIYDPLRGTAEFARIASRLRELAGDWEVPMEADRDASV